MACRVIHSFGSGVCEALPVQLVNDIFFLHERGKRLGYYTGAPINVMSDPLRRLTSPPSQCVSALDLLVPCMLVTCLLEVIPGVCFSTLSLLLPWGF